MSSVSKVFLFAALAGLTVQGCRCGEVTSNPLGEVRILTVDTAGTEIGGPDGTYDFGNVSMGKTGTLQLRVQNVGRGALTIQSFTKRDGDATTVGTFVTDANPVFDVNFTEATTVGTGDTQAFDMTFSPPEETGVQQHAYQVVLVMTSGDVAEGGETAVITLKGNAIAGACDLPDSIDFGAVAIGDSFDFDFDYVNNSELDTHGYLGTIESQQGDGIFTLSPESPKGEFLIPTNRTKTAKFTFKPTENHQYLGLVRMRRADGCPEKIVRLLGDGVASVLSWTPASVDFGYSQPNTTTKRQVTFSNASLAPITLSGLTTRDTQNTGVFAVSQTDSADLTAITVPAASRDGASGMIVPGTVVLEVSFSPLLLGPRNGSLNGVTPLLSQPQVQIPLKGVGGGPDIKVTPSPVMNFGHVAYFANASPPSSGTRNLTIQNIGTRPTPPDSRANLKLGKDDGTGAYVGPYWSVRAITGDASEICVGDYDTVNMMCPTEGTLAAYNPATGLEAGTGALALPIRIAPTGPGDRVYELTIFSNDPDSPETVVTINATAIEAAPCDVEVSPISVAFGIITPPTVKDLGFQIRNRSTTDICLLSDLQLLPEQNTPSGFPAIFSLPADFSTPTNPLNEFELQPGETKQVVVRAWPQGQLPANPVTVIGKVQFNAAHPTNPVKQVSVTATLATACLTISPSAVDFGTVKKDCSSAERTIKIYNSCSSEVVINSASLGTAAGEAAGGPNCPGTSPCPEFFITSGIAGGTRLSATSATSVDAALKYRPINYGADTGAMVINVTQAGQTLDYVVALTGTGDTEGLNTDVFRQDSKPKADILLVIDDSGSMSEEQQAVAENMNAFLTYATTNQVDFHIAVTNTELTDPDHGIFCKASGTPSDNCPHGNKFLTPQTPDLLNEFAALVHVGTSGFEESCMDPATKALTSPYINDPTKNAGFLRNDAVLAVVCVTDANDQADEAPVYYLNQLLNVKGSQHAAQFSYNVIGPFLANPSSVPNCSYDGSGDDGRHNFMVQQTNGVKEEICTQQWSTALERIGKNAFGYRTNFFLTSRPDLSHGQPIVTIDGEVIPATDPDFGSLIWTYDATNNSINFESLYVPQAGSTLQVTYTASCYP